jgi:hypothetical protein
MWSHGDKLDWLIAACFALWLLGAFYRHKGDDLE